MGRHTKLAITLTEEERALQLFAAFDTQTGKVYGRCFERKRQTEFIAFLEHLDGEIPATVTTIHLVLDNVSTHHGREVRVWLTAYPRFIFHFTPVQCSWMNQVEQWFGILQRKRLGFSDFASQEELRQQLEQFIAEWNANAHPFTGRRNRSLKSWPRKRPRHDSASYLRNAVLSTHIKDQ